MDKSTKNLVSVILPAYNAEKYIGEAIESVLKQTYPSFELIVVDDGSQDRTAEIVKSFNDERIHLFKHAENKGLSSARNTAIEASHGRWIAPVDADDQWLPQRLEKMIDILLENGDGYFVGDNSIICFDTPEGLKPWVYMLDTYGIKSNEEILEISFHDYLMQRMPAFQPIFPIKPVNIAGLKYNPVIKSGEDFEFHCNLFRIGLKLKLFTTPFYLYRLTPGSVTSKPEASGVRALGLLLANEGFSNEEKNIFKSLLSRSENENKYRRFAYALKTKDFLKAILMFIKNPLLLIKLIIRLPHSLKYRITAKIYGANIK